MTPKTASKLRVEDVMTRNPITVSLDTSVRELAQLFDANDISGAPVVDAQGRIVGVVSKTDLIHRCIEGPVGSGPQSFFAQLAEGVSSADLDTENLGTVGDFMTTDAVTATVNEPLVKIAHRMASENVHRVVVVDESLTAIGMVTTLDVLKNFPE
ncbi:MAG: CBS domain-containing protein [Planctomycetes bacterium]|nr:CBS domain-containing protein [Planctomycetota bacterium]